MQIETLVVGPIETNCYLVYNSTNKALIIDPGDQAELIKARIEKLKIQPVAILNTHGHYDHILADTELHKTYRIPVYYPEADVYLISLQQQLYAVSGFSPDRLFTDKIDIPGFSIEVISTPGHTKGSTCFLIEGILFSGDMLFAEGYLGRTDLWGGSDRELQESLQKLLTLPSETKVYAGHGPATTIGQEKTYYAR